MDGEKEMKSFFKSDYFLMIVSVVISIFMWIYIAYDQNPIYEKWIKDIPIVYTNQSADFESGKLVVLDGKKDTVDVKIRGRRSIMSAVDATDITCTVNMSEVTKSGSYSIPISFSSSVYGVELTQKNPYSVDLVVDKTVTDEIEVTVTTSGSTKDGFVVGEIISDPKIIKLTGPQSIIWSVETAVATVDVTGADADIVNLYKIKLYNESGAEITDDRISKNIEYCDVTCRIYEKKQLNVTPLLDGEFNSMGERIAVSAVNPQSITLIGTKEQLEQINGIYTKNINVFGIMEPVTMMVQLDLSDLPMGVTVDSDVSEVEVQLYNEQSQQVQQNPNDQQEQQNDNGGNE